MRLNVFNPDENPLEKHLYCFGGDDDDGGGGGDSRSEADRSYEDDFGFSDDTASGYSGSASDIGGTDFGGSDDQETKTDTAVESTLAAIDTLNLAGIDTPMTGGAFVDPNTGYGIMSDIPAVDYKSYITETTPTTSSSSFLDSDSDGIPDYIDSTPYASTTMTQDQVYNLFGGTDVTTTTEPKVDATDSFAGVYDAFADGNYTVPEDAKDTDSDGIPNYLDSDTVTPYSPRLAWQEMPDYTFQKQLYQNPEAALKSFGAKAKKIDTLKNGQDVYTVKMGQKSPITGEVIDRSFVYTTGPDGQTIKDLFNITDENTLTDSIGNALGFGIPLAMGLPVRASVDTKVLNRYATEDRLYKDYSDTKQYYETSALSTFEEDITRKTRIETEAERASRLAQEEAQRQKDSNGGDDKKVILPTTGVTEKEKYTVPANYEEYFKKFMGSAPRYQSPYDVLRGRVTAAEGGEIGNPDDYLQVNAEYVRQMPDAFMRDPNMASTPEELRAILAHNRRVKSMAEAPQMMNEGGVAVVGESGPIVTNPEQVTEADSVADNVEKTVPEGTFIINQPAAELMGTSDIKDMLMNAVKELRKQGVDFSFGEGKIAEEDAVSLLVSKGEIMIHPLLVEVIGLDRLNKINNRGKAEVEKRIAKNGQSPEAEQAPVLAKSGGFIAMRDGGEVNPDQSIIDYHYNTIQKNKVGRDKEGRPITVYSTSIYIPEGKNKGKFALVPGYVDGSIDYSEDQLYQIWKEEIESGKWPVDSSGEESGKRAQRIHQVMDRDADTMPELKKEGGLTSFRGEGTSGDNQSYANIEAEYSGDGFIVKPRANYSEQNTTRNFPDGVVVNQKGKNIGFALNGEMFLSDDTSLRAGIERQANRSKTKVNLPENYGGQTLEFGGGQTMKRYNMGATFGDFSADISKQQGAGQPLSGRVEYKFSPQGEVFIEGTEGGRSGRVGLQYRF